MRADIRVLSILEFVGRTMVAGAVLSGVLLAACGTSQPEIFTIGVVNLSAGAEVALDGFKGGMAELGYVEGENVTYIYDGPVSGVDALEPAVQKLAARPRNTVGECLGV